MSQKSWSLMKLSMPFERYLTQSFLKLPTLSFFFTSTEMIKRPFLIKRADYDLIHLNCRSLSEPGSPHSAYFLFYWRLKSIYFSIVPTVVFKTL